MSAQPYLALFAEPWIQTGSAAIVVKDPKDQAVRAQVERLLKGLAADPNNGIAQILDAKEIAALGGTPGAATFGPPGWYPVAIRT